MKNKLLRRFLFALFTVTNTALLFLFLLQLPYGLDTLIYSLLHWPEMHPQIDIAAGASISIAFITVFLITRLDSEWKSRMIYFRARFAHPGHHAFLGGKDPGFDRKPLKTRYPKVSDSAYDPKVQMQVWKTLYKKHAQVPLVQGTHSSWVLLRDLYFISLIFLVVFLLAWPVNFGVPIALTISYLFIYGAQFIFLLLSARGTGLRLESNVLAAELGIKPGRIEKAKN